MHVSKSEAPKELTAYRYWELSSLAYQNIHKEFGERREKNSDETDGIVLVAH